MLQLTPSRSAQVMATVSETKFGALRTPSRVSNRMRSSHRTKCISPAASQLTSRVDIRIDTSTDQYPIELDPVYDSPTQPIRKPLGE